MTPQNNSIIHGKNNATSIDFLHCCFSIPYGIHLRFVVLLFCIPSHASFVTRHRAGLRLRK